MLKNLLLGGKFLSSIIYTDETIEILRLIRSENVGPKTFFGLINLFGNAKQALENIEEFSIRGGRSKPIKVYSKSDAEKELALLAKNNAHIITYKSPEYSNLLLEIGDCPPILSYKGNIKLLNHKKSIAIVGARNASGNGRILAAKFAQELIEQGYVIVSGLARGIDTAVHQKAPDKALAVIAGGIDHIYPEENRELYEEIIDAGLLIAELPIGSKPLSQHFPQRNRLIAGLALGTIVVEASLKSGSLITARMALEQNREVFAVPGFPADPRCQGTNKLIKEGAHLLETIQDVIYNLPNYEKIKKSLEDSSNTNNNFKSLDVRMYNQINKEMRAMVTELLSSTPTDFNYIVKETSLPLGVIYTIILELELAGHIIRYPGNKIALIFK